MYIAVCGLWIRETIRYRRGLRFLSLSTLLTRRTHFGGVMPALRIESGYLTFPLFLSQQRARAARRLICYVRERERDSTRLLSPASRQESGCCSSTVIASSPSLERQRNSDTHPPHTHTGSLAVVHRLPATVSRDPLLPQTPTLLVSSHPLHSLSTSSSNTAARHGNLSSAGGCGCDSRRVNADLTSSKIDEILP